MKVSNWDTWQTFRKDRGTPPWIKVYRNLLSNPEWVSLTDAEKGQLISIWILAADKSGSIPDSPRLIQRMAMLDDPPNINKFIELKFLTPTRQPDDNQAVTACPQVDPPETEKSRVEKRKRQTPRKRGSRLPDDWKPSKEDITYCKDKRPDLNWQLVAENFRDYWIAKPGAGGVKLDWSATWRTWVRKEKAENYASQPSPPPKNPIKITSAMIKKLAKPYGEHGEYHVKSAIGTVQFTSEKELADHVRVMLVHERV